MIFNISLRFSFTVAVFAYSCVLLHRQESCLADHIHRNRSICWTSVVTLQGTQSISVRKTTHKYTMWAKLRIS